MKAIPGTIHGTTIELSVDPGLPPGIEVEVVVRQRGTVDHWGEGIRASAGAWADEPGIDEILDEMERMRRVAQWRDEEP